MNTKMPQIIGLILSFGILLKAMVSLHSHSGEATPPMFGDYEAQRHWQEITYNLPIDHWYEHTIDNDLMYWGLDYPPLTAYHSWSLGLIANHFNESYVQLKLSRGMESIEHKYFMRSSVLVADLFIYMPALLLCCWFIYKYFKYKEANVFYVHLTIAVLYPGQILIDNGHFQYNNISLGLTAIAIACILNGTPNLAAVFFTLSLNYKQMELYHALPIFFYLLAYCYGLQKRLNTIESFKRLVTLAFIVIGICALIWFPWLNSWSKLAQILHRIFPLARGIFEDKVSNIWCIINVLIPLKEKYTNQQMASCCLLLTITSILPSCIHLFLRPTKKHFLLSLINCSLAFFLFSFQVHEKSILLATLPVILYFPFDPLACLWFLQIATFSMLPLLLRDGLLLPYITLNLIYFLSIKIVNDTANAMPIVTLKPLYNFNWIRNNVHFIVFSLSMLGTFILLCANVMIEPPIRWPHLFPLIISVYSCIHFLLFFLYFNIKQFSIV